MAMMSTKTSFLLFIVEWQNVEPNETDDYLPTHRGIGLVVVQWCKCSLGLRRMIIFHTPRRRVGCSPVVQVLAWVETDDYFPTHWGVGLVVVQWCKRSLGFRRMIIFHTPRRRVGCSPVVQALAWVQTDDYFPTHWGVGLVVVQWCKRSLGFRRMIIFQHTEASGWL